MRYSLLLYASHAIKYWWAHFTTLQSTAPSRVQGQSLPEAEAFLAFARSMEATKLPTFLNFGKRKTSDICVIFAKNHGWVRNWGGMEQNLGACAPPPPAWAYNRHCHQT